MWNLSYPTRYQNCIPCIPAAAAAKSLQLCPTLWDPIDSSPPGSAVPGILQARVLEWVDISFSNARKWKVKVKLLSHVRLFAIPWTAAYQAPPSMGFSRQAYWSGLPLPAFLGRLLSPGLPEKSLLMKVKEEREKVDLKLNIQKTKIMASSPIMSWQIDGETVETVADFIFLGSNITADGDCSHEIKRHLRLGRKTTTNLDSILKSRDITLSTKVCLVKAMVFPVVMYGCESWSIKKAECQRIDVCKLWYWRRLLRVPWTARRSNQSILKEISPGCSLEGLMLKLKLQYFGHLMQRADSFEKILMLGKIEGRRRRGRQRMRWLDGIIHSMDMGLIALRELVIARKAWHAVVHGVAKSRTRMSDWTELNQRNPCTLFFFN